MTTEQNELIEKLNCLEFETSQLNHAYQLWRSNVEQGTAPDWMAAAIRITYDALITFCLDTVLTLPPDTGNAGEPECYERSGESVPSLDRPLPAVDSTTALCLRHAQPLHSNDGEADPPARVTALVDGSLALTPLSRQNQIVGTLALADVPRPLSARRLAQLEAATCEVSCLLAEESTTAEPAPELLPMKERDWSLREIPIAISPLLNGHAISKQSAIQQARRADETWAEPATVHTLATLSLPNWLQRSSNSRFFGPASVAIMASVAILMVAGGALGIYMASPHRAAHTLPLQNSAAQAEAGAVAIPTGEKAEFKFDPDPLVAPVGSSFVINAVLSRGSDIASVAAEIDYDANLLQFMGVSEGGFLIKDGRQVVLAQRNDPLTGVLKVSAEQSPGNPGISGDGPIFALSFQARKKGKATLSIVPGAHDSQGRRIEMTGSEVSVRVN